MALNKAFAENGDKVKISENKTDNGVLNYDEGFGKRYEQPIKAVIDEKGNITSTGGLQITRPQFNGLMNDITSAIIENQNNILANQQAIQENLAKIEALRAYADNRFSGCAGLDLPNVFSQLNQFKGGIEASKATFSATTSIINPTLWKDLKDNDVPTKAEIVKNVGSLLDSASIDFENLASLNKQNVFTQPQMYDSAVTSNIILPDEAFLTKNCFLSVKDINNKSFIDGEQRFWDKNVNVSLINKILFKKDRLITIGEDESGYSDFDSFEELASFLNNKMLYGSNSARYIKVYKDITIDNFTQNTNSTNIAFVIYNKSNVYIKNNMTCNINLYCDPNNKAKVIFENFTFFNGIFKINNLDIVGGANIIAASSIISNSSVTDTISYSTTSFYTYITSSTVPTTKNIITINHSKGVAFLPNVTNKCNVASGTITNKGYVLYS